MSDPEAESPRESVTRALDALSRDEPDAEHRLLEVVYGELRRLARQKMSAQPSDHTLQPTALVHEAYLRLLGQPERACSFPDRHFFFSAAAKAMRSILVDHARKKAAEKRGGGRAHVTLSADLGVGEPEEQILLLNDSLELFAAKYARQARVLELLFFGGLSVAEAAAALDVSERTVKRDWRFGKSWILARIESDAS